MLLAACQRHLAGSRPWHGLTGPSARAKRRPPCVQLAGSTFRRAYRSWYRAFL